MNGLPSPRQCAPGFWWDVVNEWCVFPEHVTCDNRTVITPPPATTTSPLITTTTPISGNQPNITGCWQHADLFNGQVYHKSMCMINRPATYENARIQCRDHNMNLYIVESEVSHILILEQIQRHVAAQHPTGHIILNGRRDEGLDDWFVQDPNDNRIGRLWPDIPWFRTQTIDGRVNGPCLRYQGRVGIEYQAIGSNCNEVGWFICEHGHPQTTPDPTQPTVIPTTTPSGGGPNIGACAQRDDLFDDNNNYLKSLCIMVGGQNYDGAQGMCRSNRMELFAIDSFMVQREFRASVSNLLSGHPGGFVWINGRVDNADVCRNWFTFTPDRRQLFDGVHWVQTDAIVGRTSGECLRFTAAHSVGTPPLWQSEGVACNLLSWYICEYNR